MIQNRFRMATNTIPNPVHGTNKLHESFVKSGNFTWASAWCQSIRACWNGFWVLSTIHPGTVCQVCSPLTDFLGLNSLWRSSFTGEPWSGLRCPLTGQLSPEEIHNESLHWLEIFCESWGFFEIGKVQSSSGTDRPRAARQHLQLSLPSQMSAEYQTQRPSRDGSLSAMLTAFWEGRSSASKCSSVGDSQALYLIRKLPHKIRIFIH